MSSLAKQIRPLLYLTVRSVVNGFRRALTSPRRLIGILFFLGYYFFLFIRPALTMKQNDIPQMPENFYVQFPPMQVIDSVAFLILSVLSLFMLAGLTSANTGYKPADVDVLFSTPLSPRVLLGFRIVRDYLITLFFPLLLAIFGLAPAKAGWTSIFRDMPNPEYAGLTLRFLTIAWALMALAWVLLGYAVSLFVNRSDTASDRNKRVFIGCVVGAVTLLGGYLFMQLRSAEGTEDFLRIAQSPFLRGFFFLATLATQMVLAPFSPQGPASALIGAGGLIGISAIAYWLAMTQIPWLYDQAAIKAFSRSNTRQLQQSGDLMGAVAENIRRRNKNKPLREWFVHRLRWTGVWALIWKEIILQSRATVGLFVFLLPFAIFFGAFPAFIESARSSSRGPMSSAVSQNLFFFMQLMVVFMFTLNTAMAGFVEVLKRVDLQRPLPFKSSQLVIMEVASKGVVTWAASFISVIVAVCLRPGLWKVGLAALICVPFYSLLMSSSVFLATILFPDVDDPTQRQLRGLVTMLSIVIFLFFPAGAMAGMLALEIFPPLAALISAVIAFALSCGLAAVSGPLYANYNPSE